MHDQYCANASQLAHLPLPESLLHVDGVAEQARRPPRAHEAFPHNRAGRRHIATAHMGVQHMGNLCPVRMVCSQNMAAGQVAVNAQPAPHVRVMTMANAIYSPACGADILR